MAAAAVGVESDSAVQHAMIVEAHEIARRQAEPQLETRLTHETRQSVVGPVDLVHRLPRQIEHTKNPHVKAHANDIASLVQLDRRRPEANVRTLIVEAKGQRLAREQLEGVGVGPAQSLDDHEAIDE